MNMRTWQFERLFIVRRKNMKVLCLLLTVCCILATPSNARAVSLWSGTTVKGSSLFTDTPAKEFMVNDIVVILIEESTRAEAAADTEAEIEDDVDGNFTNWFTIDNFDSLKNILRFDMPDIKTSKANTNNLPRWTFALDNEFEGEGETTRNSSVIATIASRVVGIQPNGNLILEGKRQIKVNEETTILTVRGTARAIDVTKENTVFSSQIADLNFTLDGKGVLADMNRRGILSRVLNWMR